MKFWLDLVLLRDEVPNIANPTGTRQADAWTLTGW